MAEAEHYCADCDTHFGGPPNYMTPEEHVNYAHDSGVFRGVTNGDWKSYERVSEDIL